MMLVREFISTSDVGNRRARGGFKKGSKFEDDHYSGDSLKKQELERQTHFGSPGRQLNRIIINVRGKRFETFLETLEAFPETLLGCAEKRLKFYNPDTGEYVLNRDNRSFDAILFYYQSKGILSRPNDVVRHVFTEELNFFEIDEYFDNRHRHEQQVKEKLLQKRIEPQGKIANILWQALEYPHSSLLSKLITYLSVIVILVSVFSFCAETVPALKVETKIEKRNITRSNSTITIDVEVTPFDYWFVIEIVCIVWFTFEYLIRLFASPARKKFLFSPLGVVDALVIFPFFITLLIKLTNDTVEPTAFPVLRAMRLIRIIRIFKLSRYYEGLKVLISTVYESAVHLRSLLLVISIMALLFAAVIYYTERAFVPDSRFFRSVPDSIWYTLITQTGVGYGDMYPESAPGKLVGAACALFGVLVFCLPAPMLVNKFIECYYLRQSMAGDESDERKAVIEQMKEAYL